MLCNMYLFNAGLNKYEYVKHCIIVANTYGHGVISLLLSLFYCWVTRPPVEATPPKPSWWHHAHAWEFLHHAHPASCTWRQPCACAKALPVAWRLYVGVARPLPAFQKQATASQGRQRWYCYQRWRLPRLDMHKQHLVNCVWHCKYIVNSSVLLVNNNWMYLLFILQTSHIFGLARLLLCYALCVHSFICVWAMVCFT